MGKYFKKLVGENIYLSPRSTEDAEQFTKWLNDFGTTDYLQRSSQLVTIESEKEYLDNRIKEEAVFCIVKLENDEMIGTCGIENISHLHRTGTLGIFIGEEKDRNLGYGTQALQLLLEYGFKYLNLNNIMLNVLSFNERAIKTYTQIGFQEIGKRRKSCFIDGVYYDRISMDILAEEFTGNYIKNKNI